MKSVRIVSVNVGLPREIVWRGITVQTATFKEPADGPVTISKLNLAGDRQPDLMVHGGPAKAVYVYPSEHYAYWREKLPFLVPLMAKRPKTVLEELSPITWCRSSEGYLSEV